MIQIKAKEGRRFRVFREHSEDSRHFYVPPLSHAGLAEAGPSRKARPVTEGATGRQPVHMRTTAAVDEALKGPAQFMHEIRGALDDLKALSKMQISSPGQGRSVSASKSPRKKIGNSITSDEKATNLRGDGQLGEWGSPGSDNSVDYKNRSSNSVHGKKRSKRTEIGLNDLDLMLY